MHPLRKSAPLIIKIFSVASLLLAGCVSSGFKKSYSRHDLRKEGYYLKAGCQIFDLDGKVVRSYPGRECLFLDDGSLLSYDTKKIRLTKYNEKLQPQWSLDRHVHHEATFQTPEGKFIIASSEKKDYQGLKDVRFDEVIQVSASGKIEKTFSFTKNIAELRGQGKFDPYPFDWDSEYGFQYEMTHLAAIHPVMKTMKIDKKIFAPKGSFLLTLNVNGVGVYVLDEKLEKIIGYKRLSDLWFIHDVQQFSSSKLIYIINNYYPKAISRDEEFRIAIFDVFKNQITHDYTSDFYGLFGGSIQALRPDLFLVGDNGSRLGKVTRAHFKDVRKARYLLHRKTKSRAIFYSPEQGKIHEIHLSFRVQNLRALKLGSFLKRNIGI